VTLIPTWNAVDPEAVKVAVEMGCTVKLIHPRHTAEFQIMRDASVVSFCNENAFKIHHLFPKLNCRFIFVPCMCYPDQTFRTAMRQGHVHAVVYQSRYQQGEVERRLAGDNYRHGMGHLIRGYFDWDAVEYQPVPHAPHTPFVIGRIARPHPAKWNRNWWEMYGKVPDRKAVLLGFGGDTRKQIGRPPDWAEIHAPGSKPAADIYRQLHAYVTCNESDQENWPRTGLEAMAYGVPIVAERRYGWQEMLENGVSGLLGDSWDEIGTLAAGLATDEDRRLAVAAAARERLRSICDPEEIWDGWKAVLGA
jgi:hypothetical protein